MLHDLLFSLLGKPGSFIKQFQNSAFYVDESLNLFSKPEVHQLNQIITLGFHYQQIDKFLQARAEDKSSYVKALCFGIDKSLDAYRQVILKLEQDYLKEKLFIVSQLNVTLSPFSSILLNLFNCVNYIQQYNLRGGQIIDSLYERTLTGNEQLQRIFQSILDVCYSVLYKQLASWIQYGQILDTFEEFFIQRIDENKSHTNQEYNWDTSFTINVQMLPLHFCSLEIAEKILFIGKAVKVLKAQSEFYLSKDFALVQALQHYDSFTFNKVIEELQKNVGEELVAVIQEKSQLQHNLRILRAFTLLDHGDFYQNLLEDTASILSLPHTNHALQQLNFHLQKMEQIPNEKFELIIYNNGFDYKNFNSLSNLQIKNNVIQTVNILRMGPARGPDDWSGIFRDVKQSIENGFTCQLVFKFRQLLQKQAPGYQALQVNQGPTATSVALLFFQDEDNQVVVRALLDTTKVSYLQVETVVKGKCDVLYKWKLDKIDFSEGDLHGLKINYQNDELHLIFDDQSTEKIQNTETVLAPNRWVKVPLKFQKYIQLELGRCFVGIKCYGAMIDLCSWKMVGSNFMNDASWSGLTLKYHIEYPLSLLITPALQEKLQLFFRYLFPIRHALYELQQVWLVLIKTFRKRECQQIVGLYSLLMHIINALYSYFQTDIIAVQWSKMLEKIERDNNFESMRRILNEFEQSVSNQLFLNLQQIVKNIFSIIKDAHRFIELVKRDQTKNPRELNKECYKLRLEFDHTFKGLFNLITLLTKNTNQTSLFQLLTRLDYNNFFDEKLNQTF